MVRSSDKFSKRFKSIRLPSVVSTQCWLCWCVWSHEWKFGSKGFNWLLLTSLCSSVQVDGSCDHLHPVMFGLNAVHSVCLPYCTVTPLPPSRSLALSWSGGGLQFVSRPSYSQPGERNVYLWSPKPCNLARKVKAFWRDCRLVQMRPCWTRGTKWHVISERRFRSESVGSMYCLYWCIWYNG